MSYISRDEIHGVLIQSGPEKILLPNATVAEVTSRVSIDSATQGQPHWVIGHIAWSGWNVPLISFARYTRLGDDIIDSNNKVIILKALSGRQSLPYWALVTGSFPQLVSISRDGLLADASEDALPKGVHMRVLLADQHVLVPDLDHLENALFAVVAHH